MSPRSSDTTAYKTSSIHLEAQVSDKLRKLAEAAEVSMSGIVSVALKDFWKGKKLKELTDDLQERGVVRRRSKV